MKIVVMTNKSSIFGMKLLNNLIGQGIELEAVIVVKNSFKYYRNLFKLVRKRVGLFDALYFSGERLLHQMKATWRARWEGKLLISKYAHTGLPVFYVNGTNSGKCLNILTTISPDIIILAHTGIVRRDLLKTAKIGVLNAHPGILPYYRGIDCARWAIYNDEFYKIGCSVHWVDEGIDTGDIIAKKLYKFTGTETIYSLDENLYDLCVLLLTQVVSSLWNGHILSWERQVLEVGKQYYKIPRSTENIVKWKLKTFLSTQLENYPNGL